MQGSVSKVGSQGGSCVQGGKDSTLLPADMGRLPACHLSLTHMHSIGTKIQGWHVVSAGFQSLGSILPKKPPDGCSENTPRANQITNARPPVPISGSHLSFSPHCNISERKSFNTAPRECMTPLSSIWPHKPARTSLPARSRRLRRSPTEGSTAPYAETCGRNDAVGIYQILIGLPAARAEHYPKMVISRAG